MTLLPGERAANPAHKFAQPDFAALWWWEKAWNRLTMEWFLAGEEKILLAKQGFLSSYGRLNPGDATGKSLPSAEWLMEYYAKLGDVTYENGRPGLVPTKFDPDPDVAVTPAILFAEYCLEMVRARTSGFDYQTSSRAGLLFSTARLTEADWRYLKGAIEALEVAQEDSETGREGFLLTEIAQGLSSNPYFRELTGEGVVESPADWVFARTVHVLETDAGLGAGVSNLPELVRHPETTEPELKRLHSLILNLPTGLNRPMEVLKQSLRWIEAHPNWTVQATPSFSIPAPGEDGDYFIGYDVEMIHPTLFGDAVSPLTPKSLRFTTQTLDRALRFGTDISEEFLEPELWSSSRMIAGHHALVNFDKEQLRPLLLGALGNPEEAIPGLASALMPAFGAMLEELVEPYVGKGELQVPLEWILELESR